jgi:hypothetical protein
MPAYLLNKSSKAGCLTHKMSTIQEIESAIQRLSKAEMHEIHDWLENMLEDQLELKDEFKARIETSESEMKKGKQPRLRQP